MLNGWIVNVCVKGAEENFNSEEYVSLSLVVYNIIMTNAV